MSAAAATKRLAPGESRGQGIDPVADPLDAAVHALLQRRRRGQQARCGAAELVGELLARMADMALHPADRVAHVRELGRELLHLDAGGAAHLGQEGRQELMQGLVIGCAGAFARSARRRGNGQRRSDLLDLVQLFARRRKLVIGEALAEDRRHRPFDVAGKAVRCRLDQTGHAARGDREQQRSAEAGDRGHELERGGGEQRVERLLRHGEIGRCHAGGGKAQRRHQSDEGEQESDADEIAVRRGEEPRGEASAGKRMKAQIVVGPAQIMDAGLALPQTLPVFGPGGAERRCRKPPVEAGEIPLELRPGAARPHQPAQAMNARQGHGAPPDQHRQQRRRRGDDGKGKLQRHASVAEVIEQRSDGGVEPVGRGSERDQQIHEGIRGRDVATGDHDRARTAAIRMPAP